MRTAGKIKAGALSIALFISTVAPVFMLDAPSVSYAAEAVSVQYRTADGNVGDNQMKPHFNIVNQGNTSVSLSDLKLRYYFSLQGDPAQQFNCDWAQVGCSNVMGALVPMASPSLDADHYLEISFTENAGALAPGSQSGDIQSRVHKVDWSNYNEADDYSYIGSQSAYGTNSKITLYRNGTLIAGVEPGGIGGEVPPPEEAPPAPSGLTAVSGNGDVRLTWNPAAGATGYSIKRATVDGGPYTIIAANVTSTSFTDAGLSNGATYYYVVSAVNGMGASSNSAQVSATPSAPSSTSITGETTIAAMCPNFIERHIPRTFLDYLPGQTSGGHHGSDHTGPGWMSDTEKAAIYGFQIEAVRSKINDGSLKLSELGTQALGHVQRLDALGFPRNGICQLLPRLSLLGAETEPATFHKDASNPWAETSGPIAATNNPALFIQQLWPTDARTYQPSEKAERDRIHDQPIHEGNVGWTFSGQVSDSILYDKTNPVLAAIRSKLHPVTGQPLGGSGFTSNAPMEATAKMHVQNEGFWYQVLQFKNTSEVPYFLDGAVIWWVGPSGLSFDLRNGHYNNSQRPAPGLGHPQRDIIEVVYDADKKLSAYVIRLAFHDEPYNMRTAYPNQYWSLEVGVPSYIDGQARYTTSAERQELVDLMVNNLHVELERDMDRNIDLLNALKLRNRVSN
jgi:hypothetical protein